MKNHWTHKECNTILAMYKDKTAWFGNNEILGENKPFTFNEMFQMLHFRMGFGLAETNVIIASLIKCGAKII